MISVDGLAVAFGGTTLFKDISFVINDKDRIALMGQDNRYLLPVYPGDTLEASWTVLEVRPARQPARWLLELTGQTRNQHGNVVLESRAQVMWMLPR